VSPLSRVLTVFVGGFVGTSVRALILEANAHLSTTMGAFPRPVSYAYPMRLMAINTVGVFLASWLLHGPLRHPERIRARLLLLTGTLGGLTSYSALVTEGHLATQHGLAPLVALVALSASLAALAAVGGRLAAVRRGVPA